MKQTTDILQRDLAGDMGISNEDIEEHLKRHSEPVYGGGSYVCEKCGRAHFGSTIHYCEDYEVSIPPVEDIGKELPVPIGQFIIDQKDILRMERRDGHYWHYKDVCTLLKRIINLSVKEQNKYK